MPPLPEIFLRNLQLDRLIRFRHRAEERRRGLAYLKIDRPIFDLENHVRIELAVERLENVVRGARAISLHVVPVEMMVIYKPAIKEDAAVRLQRTRERLDRKSTRLN